MDIELINFGFFRLDAGPMFGIIPKNIWRKLVDTDSENCLKLATNSLFIKTGDKRIVIDTGCGNKWDERKRKIYKFEHLKELHQIPGLTDIIITHLHFDHSGGLTIRGDENSEPVLSYPDATIYIQKDNFNAAIQPFIRERASYLKENIAPLESGKLELLEGRREIIPGVTVHVSNGHTKGLQWVEIENDGLSFVFPGDIIPTSHHLPLTFGTGFDLNTELLVEEKRSLLEKAQKKEQIIIFQHDPQTVAGTITVNDKGHFCLKEKFTMAEFNQKFHLEKY